MSQAHPRRRPEISHSINLFYFIFQMKIYIKISDNTQLDNQHEEQEKETSKTDIGTIQLVIALWNCSQVDCQEGHSFSYRLLFITRVCVN